MKLYADYIKEREGRECKYTENCFVTYKIYDDNVSVFDIYSKPEVRGKQETLKFIQNFFNELKESGKKRVFGFTDERTEGWENSERLMIKLGFNSIGKNPEDNKYNNYMMIL